MATGVTAPTTAPDKINYAIDPPMPGSITTEKPVYSGGNPLQTIAPEVPRSPVAQTPDTSTTGTPAAGAVAQVNTTQPYVNNVTPTVASTSGVTTATQNQAGTVQGQLANIIDNNSPLMQRAAAKANEQSNARGMLNSSMAVGAAQGAVMDSAMPIAQADAASNNQFNLTNTAAQNQNAQFNAGQNQQNSQFNNTQQQQTNVTNAQLKQANDVQNVVEQNKAAAVAQDALNKANIADKANEAQIAAAANTSAAFVMNTMNADIKSIQDAAYTDKPATAAVIGTGTAANPQFPAQPAMSAADQKTRDINAAKIRYGNAINVIAKLGGIQVSDAQGNPIDISALLNPPA